jgi:hypothetical protein
MTFLPSILTFLHFLFLFLLTPPQYNFSPILAFSALRARYTHFAACYWGVLGVQPSWDTVLPCPGEDVRLAHLRRSRRHAYPCQYDCTRLFCVFCLFWCTVLCSCIIALFLLFVNYSARFLHFLRYLTLSYFCHRLFLAYIIVCSRFGVYCLSLCLQRRQRYQKSQLVVLYQY